MRAGRDKVKRELGELEKGVKGVGSSGEVAREEVRRTMKAIRAGVEEVLEEKERELVKMVREQEEEVWAYLQVSGLGRGREGRRRKSRRK